MACISDRCPAHYAWFSRGGSHISTGYARVSNPSFLSTIYGWLLGGKHRPVAMSMHIPYLREKGPMGGAPYIDLDWGMGRHPKCHCRS